MAWIGRVYTDLIETHLSDLRQMVFLMGPRQVGKTALAKHIGKGRSSWKYLNWDNVRHRKVLLAGVKAVCADLVSRAGDEKPLLVLDEIHKHSKWKGLLKGLFDLYGDEVSVVVTGSARLDVFQHGGDSLMGRYFPYRLHPFSVAELAWPKEGVDGLWRQPKKISETSWNKLLDYGGFPEPFVIGNKRFHRQWRRQRAKRLLTEDLRDLTGIRELGQVEVLAELLRHRVGQLTSYTSYANELNCSIETARRWLETLERLYFCFSIRPWWKNVTRALRKEPKYFLWDWSAVDDEGARFENFVASALMKAVHCWTDIGEGDFGLHFIRDKQKNEVDFLISSDGKPWILIEVKSSEKKSLSKSLLRFQEQLGVRHVFQVARDAKFVNVDCFSLEKPMIVPARTFLSQLV